MRSRTACRSIRIFQGADSWRHDLVGLHGRWVYAATARRNTPVALPNKSLRPIVANASAALLQQVTSPRGPVMSNVGVHNPSAAVNAPSKRQMRAISSTSLLASSARHRQTWHPPPSQPSQRLSLFRSLRGGSRYGFAVPAGASDKPLSGPDHTDRLRASHDSCHHSKPPAPDFAARLRICSRCRGVPGRICPDENAV